jgi:DNA repair exonuclease SbcCD ATPase subunit
MQRRREVYEAKCPVCGKSFSSEHDFVKTNRRRDAHIVRAHKAEVEALNSFHKQASKDLRHWISCLSEYANRVRTDAAWNELSAFDAAWKTSVRPRLENLYQ